MYIVAYFIHVEEPGQLVYVFYVYFPVDLAGNLVVKLAYWGGKLEILLVFEGRGFDFDGFWDGLVIDEF